MPLDMGAMKTPEGAKGSKDPKPNGQAGTPLPEINTIDFTALPDVEPPPRRFLVERWWPAAILSSFYGPAGVGKTLLAQLMGTCITANLDFFGYRVEQVPILGLLCEDDDHELERRQWRINKHYGLSNKDLRHLHIQGRLGLQNEIVTFPNGAPRVEPFFDAIIAKARKLSTDGVGIILDNRAQMIIGNENDRMVATYGGNLCAALGREANAGVLLLGHPAKADGSEYSGSTGWDAVTRSRWWLRRLPTEDDTDPRLILELVKSNYSPTGERIELAWANGVLRAVDPAHMTPADVLELKMRQGAACQAFLDALDQLTAQGRAISHSKHARQTYAPRFVHEAGLADGFSVGELEAAMNTLFADGRIKANEIVGTTKRRQPVTGIARRT